MGELDGPTAFGIFALLVVLLAPFDIFVDHAVQTALMDWQAFSELEFGLIEQPQASLARIGFVGCFQTAPEIAAFANVDTRLPNPISTINQ